MSPRCAPPGGTGAGATDTRRRAMGGLRGVRDAAARVMVGSVLVSVGVGAGVSAKAGAAPPATVAIARSFLGTPDAVDEGTYSAAQMGIEVVLQPSDPSEM